MFLGVFPCFSLDFWVNFGENRKVSEEEKLGKNRAFTAAKAASSRRSRGPKRPPRVCCSEALLRSGEDIVHSGPKFLFCF